MSSWCCGLALSHGLALHIGLTSLHLPPLDRIVQEKYCYMYYDYGYMPEEKENDVYSSFTKFYVS